jgi:hypothetical protein
MVSLTVGFLALFLIGGVAAVRSLGVSGERPGGSGQGTGTATNVLLASGNATAVSWAVHVVSDEPGCPCLDAALNSGVRSRISDLSIPQTTLEFTQVPLSDREALIFGGVSKSVTRVQVVANDRSGQISLKDVIGLREYRFFAAVISADFAGGVIQALDGEGRVEATQELFGFGAGSPPTSGLVTVYDHFGNAIGRVSLNSSWCCPPGDPHISVSGIRKDARAHLEQIKYPSVRRWWNARPAIAATDQEFIHWWRRYPLDSRTAA